MQDFEVSPGLGGITASVTTEDTMLLGFGLEQLATDEERAAVVGAASSTTWLSSTDPRRREERDEAGRASVPR